MNAETMPPAEPFTVIPTERSDEGSFTRERLKSVRERSLSSLGMTTYTGIEGRQ